ncbi:YcnI family protein [Actinomadura rugatobispora]|uniref:YcnI family protein n=1 Tax=Actinomadura rugatobispora TaxID=1994 RepID=A0ABW1A2G1_9ACTN|nr:YcnI family protein [Actinomadura rugatobispora]
MPMRAHSRAVRRSAAVAALTAVSVTGLATGAAAHVTANPRTAEQGSFAKVSFRVPNERDDAETVKLVIDMPAGHPIEHVSVRQVPGWTVKVEKAKLAAPVKIEGGELTEAVSRITWSGGKIGAGRFEEFDVSMGPLPSNAERVLFKAEQTYSSDEVVKWDQDPGSGQNEPEHPAPELKLTPKGAPAGPAGAALITAQPARAVLAGDDSADGTARLLGGLGLAVGIAGLGVGAFGLTRARRHA